jgi:coenzyme F420-reducing hydrogenase alpha subunit
MTQLKELEREKRVNDAQRNLRLAESKVESLKQKAESIKQRYDTTDVHVSAFLRDTLSELDRAESDVIDAKKDVTNADADPDVLNAAIEKMNI